MACHTRLNFSIAPTNLPARLKTRSHFVSLPEDISFTEGSVGCHQGVHGRVAEKRGGVASRGGPESVKISSYPLVRDDRRSVCKTSQRTRGWGTKIGRGGGGGQRIRQTEKGVCLPGWTGDRTVFPGQPPAQLLEHAHVCVLGGGLNFKAVPRRRAVLLVDRRLHNHRLRPAPQHKIGRIWLHTHTTDWVLDL